MFATMLFPVVVSRATATKRSYNINYQLDCNSNVVYLITCKVCRLQYVGSTSTKFRLRFNNYKSRLSAHSRSTNIDRESDGFVYKHFHGPGHQGLQNVSVQIINKVHNNEKLAVKEGVGNIYKNIRTLAQDSESWKRKEVDC